MTEFGLIGLLEVACVAFALGTSRALDRAGPAGELRRVVGAARRATWAFARRVARPVVGTTLACALLLLVAHGFLRAAWGDGVGAALGVLVGAGAACLGLLGASAVGWRVTGAVTSSAGASLDAASSALLRGGAASALVAEACAGLAVVGSFVAPLALASSASGAAPFRSMHVLAGTALGIVLVTFAIRRSGAVFAAATSSALDLAGGAAGVERGDPRNPAAIAALVGGHVGAIVGSCGDVLVLGAITAVAGALLAIDETEPRALALAWVGAPLLARAFGALATAVASLGARGGDEPSAVGAFTRAHVAATIVSGTGLAGAAVWLLGDLGAKVPAAAATALLGIGASGMVASSLATPRGTVLRESVDALRIGPVVAGAAATGGAFVRAGLGLVPLLVGLVACVGLAGSHTSGALVLSLVTAAGVGLAPFAAGHALTHAFTEGAEAVARSGAPLAPETTRRLQRLHDAAAAARAGARLQLIGTAALALVLAAYALGRGHVDLGVGGVWLALLVGGALAWTYGGQVLTVTSRGARAITEEALRQLRPRGGSSVPGNFQPSYRASLDEASSHAAGVPWWPGALVLVAPVLVALAAARLSDASAAAQSLAALVLVSMAAALAPLPGLSALDALGSALRRAPRAEADAAPAAGGSAALITLLGSSLAPALESAAHTVAIVALVLAPFLRT